MSTRVSDRPNNALLGITSSKVEKILGVSSDRVRQLRVRGDLRGTPDERGVFHYEVSEVRALAMKRESKRHDRAIQNGDTRGPIAAEVFKLLDQGCELKDIVQALTISPTLVRELYVEYKTPLGHTVNRRGLRALAAEVRIQGRVDELEEEERGKR